MVHVPQATGNLFDDLRYVDIARHRCVVFMGQQTSIEAVEELARCLLEQLGNEWSRGAMRSLTHTSTWGERP
jgi:hypothetical protein